jgi:hypothetical protein
MNPNFDPSTQQQLEDFRRQLKTLEHNSLWAATRLSEHALRRDLRALHEHYHPPSLQKSQRGVRASVR